MADETKDDLVHIPPNPEGSSAATGANQETKAPKHSHAYNRKCRKLVRFLWSIRLCPNATKSGHLLCPKHLQEEKDRDERITALEAKLL